MVFCWHISLANAWLLNLDYTIKLHNSLDCTTLTLVDAVQGEPASLIGEGQDCGVEQKDCHEGTCSAAPVAVNEECLSSAIANQTQEQVELGLYLASNLNEFSLSSAMSSDKPFHVYANQAQGQVEQGYSATLLAENSVSGVEVKAVDEGENSATPAPSAEKWSSEAIIARSNLRPERIQKFKVAANSGHNLGFDFLQECWNDDPALQIVIKKLLVKYPQWGIVCVEGILVEWKR